MVLALSSRGFSQSSDGDTGSPGALSAEQSRLVMEQRVQMAIASPDYLVTAGDVYTLAYGTGSGAVTYGITVDSSYRIRVANLGVVDARGKTWLQLKGQVEGIVANNYPLSGVQFVLSRPASFRVYVRGEVAGALERSVWALERVSSVLDSGLTAQASIRDVTVTSANGTVKSCDLFLAGRLGDLSRDPYLRPGDVITFNRIGRVVTIGGAVERPGQYQLLEGEQLRELVETYGSGFTPLADRTRMELVRYVNSRSISGDKYFLEERDIGGNYELQNFDVVTVPEISQLRPVMFVEGAIGSVDSDSPTVSTRLSVSYNRGESYSSLVRNNRGWFSAVSDTKNAYIIRGNEQIPINLNPILYDADYRSEEEIEENDTLIIPFRQYFVTVAGAVTEPGRYPYIPDRSWDYYIALAGGFIPGRNAREAVVITDINGKQLKKGDVITPETIITAQTNGGLYYFNQYAPVFTTVLSVIATALSAISLILRF
jgi:protein involved in polysaccharide export with SLBB domain